jgi:hypothetical protein
MRKFLPALFASMFVLFTTNAVAQPKAPTYLNGTVNGQNKLELRWTKMTAPAAKYRVYRNGTLLHTSEGLLDTTYVDNNPVAGQVLQYCVTSIDGLDQESPFRNCILDSTYYFNVLIASDYTSDAFVDVSWSVDVSCLRTPPSNHDVYVELWDKNTNKELYGQTIKNADLPDDTAATVSVNLPSGEYMLLDPSYVSPGNAALQQAGRAVSIDGDFAIVGAPLADGGEGAAHIYELQGGTWVQVASLKAPATSLTDSFGVSVHIKKRYAIVGAPGGLGLAHVFENTGGNTWVHRAALEADVREMTDDFGRAVAIDTFYALVGAPDKYTKAGVIYHYVRNGNTWTRLTRFFSRYPRSNQQFGYSISAEDRFMVTGGPGDLGNRGSAFAYEMIGFTWYFRTQLVVNNLLINDKYGTAVALSNGHIAVGGPGYQSGTGRVYYFRKVGTGWVANGQHTPGEANAGDRYGSAVSMFQGRLLAGAPFRAMDNGAVYVYDLSGLVWNQSDKWVRECGESADRFGSALALGDDVAMVGAAYENGGQSSVYQYHYNGSVWIDKTPLGGVVASPRSIELWVKLNGSHPGFRPLIGTNDISLNVTGALPQLNIRSGGVPVYFNYRMPHDRWTHVSLVVDSVDRKTRLYINGELTDELCNVAVLDVERIGYQVEGITQHYLNGQVFDVRSWGKVRTGAEIMGDYRHRVSAPQAGLAGYWKVDEGSGSSIGESTGNYPPASVQPSNTPQWVIDSIPATISGEFTHVVGPDKHHSYELNSYEVGFGYPLCPTLVDSGHTLPYIVPVLASDSSRPDSMRMSWTNYSDAISFYRVFRDGRLMGLIDSNAQAWADVYKYNDTATLANGQTYRYCLVPFSTRFNLVYDSICISGSTLPINFEASRNVHPDKVVMTWDNMSAFGDGIRIMRDGEFRANLDSNVTTYTDQNPLAGFQHVYEFQLLQGHNIMVAVKDTGSVPARGTIAGRVVTAVGDYALAGVVIHAEAIIGGDTITYSDTSGIAGDFSMEEVFFGNGATFSITAMAPAGSGYTIANNPLSATLNFADPYKFLTFKGTKVITPTGNGPLTFSNFNAQHLVGQDLVRLTWDYTNPDTTWFKIYRDGALIDIITDTNSMVRNSYDDLTGIPGTTYSYEVQAYRYERDTVVTEKNGTDTETLDGLAAVNELIAVAHNGEGVVKLHWDHTSTNITGFRLYRGINWIADLPLSEISKDTFYRFTDFYGIPGELYVYGIKTYVVKEGNEYESPLTYSNQVTYPGLPAPSPVLATPDPVNDQMIITWEYQKADNANFFGFRLVRANGGNTDTLAHYHKGFISGETGSTWQYTYVDRTGKPSTNYTYSVVAYKAMPYFQSPPGSDTKVYPAVSVPHNLQATLNLHPGYVKLTWDAVSNNHDGYLLIRGTDTLGWLGKDIRSFTDVFTTAPTYTEYTYRLRAFREVDGMKYVSNQITKQGSAQVLANGNLLAPQNFKASDNYPNHILLTWDYPVYILSKFFVYKDGVLYDSMDNSLRFYVDTAVVPDQQYVYQLRGRHQGVWSAMATDAGSLKSLMQVEGIASSNTGIGIPGISVLIAVDGKPMYETMTDSTGFYRVSGVKNKTGSIVTVSAAGPNAMFIDPVQQFPVVAGQNRYTVNFMDTFYHNMVPQDTGVARPIPFYAQVDPLTNKAELRWSVTNSNFSGFLLARELSPIANMLKNQPKFFIDQFAAPGHQYIYSIQAYLTEPEGTTYSDTIWTLVEVPKLAPVEGLYAFADYNEDIVKLYWSHPTDLHTFYEIKRNGTVIGTVETGNRMFFVDSTGLPGHLYKYTITAIEIGDAGLYTSDPVSVTTTFPDVAPVSNIVLSPVPGDNRVDVTWEHTSIYYHHTLIYRDGEVIDTVYREDLPKLSKDYWGHPGLSTEYAVQVVVIKNNQKYYSDTVHVATTFPVLLPPTLVSATQGVDMLTLNGTYAPVDGYTGFEFYRHSDTLEFRSGISAVFSFDDLDGAPDSMYNYRIRAFKDIQGSARYHSAFTDLNGAFPPLEPPHACNASDGDFFNHILVSWSHSSASNTGFIVYRDSATIDTIRSAGLRKFIDLVNDLEGVPPTYSYEVQAYKIYGGQLYVSTRCNAGTGFSLIQNFSEVTSYDGTSGEKLGSKVAIGANFAVAGTQENTSSASTYVLQPAGTFGTLGTLTPDPSSGNNPAFGWDVTIDGSTAAVTAPWAWDNTSTDPGYRSGEIYLYQISTNGTPTLDTILRNFNYTESQFGRNYRLNHVNNQSITESMAWSQIDSINNLPSTVGPATSGIGAISTSTDFTNGLNFTTDGPFVLNSVTVYPDSGSGNIVVRVRQGGTILHTTTQAYTNATPYAATVVNLGYNVPAAGSYSMDAVGSTIANLRFNTSGGSFAYNDTYGIVSITGNIAAGGGASPYRYFYNWQVEVPADTFGRRVHEDTLVYVREVETGTFAIAVDETAYGSDIRIDSLFIDMVKAGGQGVQLQEVSLVHVGSGNVIRLFTSSSNPTVCTQDTFRLSFQAGAPNGVFGPATANCGSLVTGLYQPMDAFTAFNGSVPSGNYRIRYKVLLHDPDNSVANTLTSTVTTNEVGVYFRTMPGGIYAQYITNNAQMGKSVAMFNTNLVGGAPNYDGSKGKVTAFNLGTGGWGYQDTLYAPLGSQGNCTYFQVNISFPGWADETRWRLKNSGGTIVASGGPYGFGGNISVSLNSNNSAHTFEIETTHGPFLDNSASYNIQGNSGQLLASSIAPNQVKSHGGLVSGCTGGLYGYSVALGSSQLLVGVPNADISDGNGRRGEVRHYGLGSGGKWTEEQIIRIQNPGPNDDQFGFSLSLSGTTLAVGAKGDDWDQDASKWDAGSVSLYEYNAGDGVFEFKRKLFNPDGPKKTFEFFGYDVAIRGNIMAIGAPGIDSSSGVTNSGAVYLYEKDEVGNWVKKRRYFAPDAQTNAGFGSSVDLFGNTLMVGAPNHGGGNGKVYFFYIREQIDSVIASDGTEGNKTRVSWVYNGVRSNLSNFHVYRDSVLIAAIDPHKSFMFDYDGIPGKKYVYRVAPVSLDDVEGITKGDIGWSIPNGILDGSAITFIGGSGVPDVNIEAWAEVEGETFRYNRITDQAGKYKITDMYYGDTTLFYVRAWKTGHEFLEDTLTMPFNLQQNIRGLDPFRDLTAFIVKGRLVYENTNCPIEGLQVTQIAKWKDSTQVIETANSDADGYFTFNIKPYDNTIAYYRYVVDSSKTVQIDSTTQETTYFNFNPTTIKLGQLDTIVAQDTRLPDFEDQTTYKVQVFVRDVCGPIGQNRWKVLVESDNGCYKKLVTTSLNGRILLHLPPLAFNFRVIGVETPTPNTLPVVDYLKVRPRQADLEAIHMELGGTTRDTTVPMDFIFHTSPQIAILNLDNFLCADPALPVVLNQGDIKSYTITVNELSGTQSCHVNEGYLIIRNNAARGDSTSPTTVQIDVDPKAEKFPDYTFQVGDPNVIAPYTKWMFIEYHTPNDGFLGEISVAFIIQGIGDVPGTDIIVTPDSADDNLLLPLFVLRDPPGDGSSSSIDSGKTFSAAWSMSNSHLFKGGVDAESKTLFFGFGFGLGGKFEQAGGWGDGSGFTIEAETMKSFSTSDASNVDNAAASGWLTGESADVIVGAGIATSYGIGREIFVDDTCGVISKKVFTLGSEIKTTWMYTVDHIEHLIREYEDNIEAAKIGKFIIQGKTKDETILFLTIRKMNWEELLRYHRVTTVPYYALCDPANFAEVPEPWASAARSWRTEGFCTKIGNYSADGNTFTLKPSDEWAWDTDLLTKYNKISDIVRRMEKDSSELCWASQLQ